jgi:hypothetical protein
MQVVAIKDAGRKFEYKWPSGDTEIYDYFVEYSVIAEDGQHSVKIGFGKRPVYGTDRVRVVVWIDGYPHAQFLGTDDFERSGEVLSEIKIAGSDGERICRYPDDVVPERYSMFRVEGLPIRIRDPGVYNAWAIVSNIADHKTLIALAMLRRLERRRRK